MLQPRVRMLILSLVGVVTAGAVWWNLERESLANDANAYVIKTALPIYRSLPYARLTDYDDVHEHFHSANVINTSVGERVTPNGRYSLELTPRLEQVDEPVHVLELSERQVDALLTQTAELVYYRLFQDDPALYVRHRNDRKAYAPSEQRLGEIGWGELDPMIEYYLERERRPGDTAATIVTESFTWWKDRTSVDAVRGFARGPVGLVCTLGLIDSTRAVSVDLYTTELGVDGWSGAAPRPSGVFLFPTKTAEALIDTYGALPYAMVGSVVDYENAAPQAIVFIFMWNPDIDDWHFMSALFVNRKDQDARLLPHF